MERDRWLRNKALAADVGRTLARPRIFGGAPAIAQFPVQCFFAGANLRAQNDSVAAWPHCHPGARLPGRWCLLRCDKLIRAAR